MVGKYLSEFFPDEKVDDEGETVTEEIKPPAFEVRFIETKSGGSTIKTYSDQSGRQKPVWTTKMCEKRIADLIDSGKDHSEFWNGLSNWLAEQQAGGDPMLICWSDDCFQAMEDVFAQMQPPCPSTSEKPPQPVLQLFPDSKPATLDLFGTSAKAPIKPTTISNAPFSLFPTKTEGS